VSRRSSSMWSNRPTARRSVFSADLESDRMRSPRTCRTNRRDPKYTSAMSSPDAQVRSQTCTPSRFLQCTQLLYLLELHREGTTPECSETISAATDRVPMATRGRTGKAAQDLALTSLRVPPRSGESPIERNRAMVPTKSSPCRPSCLGPIASRAPAAVRKGWAIGRRNNSSVVHVGT